MEIFNCEQGSDAWFLARMGIPTASEFSTVLAKGEGKSRLTYMRKLAAEIITGEPTESYSNQYLERGKVMEDEARERYAFDHDVDPVRVGFIRSGTKGCSPDALIGDVGMLEIKTQRADLLIATILKNEFPPEHKAQCQGNLWVAEREWIDISVYWPKMPRFVKRAYRDEPYIKTLSEAVNAFNAELSELVEKIRAYA